MTKPIEYRNLADLTIVVPTYNRMTFLVRTLGFISQFPFARVVVLDGSPGSGSQSQVNELFPEVLYVHSESGFVSRLSMAASLVNTKYVALWGDDEFWLPSFLAGAVDFLNNSPNYVFCLGYAVSFDSSPNYNVSETYPGLREAQISSESAGERLVGRFDNYAWGGLWGVGRAEVWSRAWSVPELHEFNVRGATEIQFEAAISWQGGVKVLNEIAWFRSVESTSITDSSDVSLNSENMMFYDWWFRSNFLEKKGFIDVLCKRLGFSHEDYSFWYRAFDLYTKKAIRASSPPSHLGVYLVKLISNYCEKVIKFKLPWQKRRYIQQAVESQISLSSEIERLTTLSVTSQKLFEINLVEKSIRLN